MIEAIIDVFEDAQDMIDQFMSNEDTPDGFEGVEVVAEVFNANEHAQAAVLHLKNALELSSTQ